MDNLIGLADAAFTSMKDDEKNERLKEQFLEGLFSSEIKRMTCMSLNIKSCLAESQPIPFEEVVNFAITCEKIVNEESKSVYTLSFFESNCTTQKAEETQSISKSQTNKPQDSTLIGPPEYMKNYKVCYVQGRRPKTFGHRFINPRSYPSDVP